MVEDLFAAIETAPLDLAPGLVLARRFLDPARQRRLVAAIAEIAARAPFYRPKMPRSGKPFSALMTNCGPLGWVSDEGGYRYQRWHPVTGRAWPPIPAEALRVWRALARHLQPPQACLINFYDAGARMGLHQDADEGDVLAPVVSISLGDDALFRYGGLRRGEPTRSVRLGSGDVIVLGGASRLAFHGIDRIYPGTSDLLAGAPPDLPRAGRINLTMRHVARRAQA